MSNELTNRLAKVAPDCFRNPGTIANISKVPKRKSIYILNIKSNGYNTNDRLKYNSINSLIYIKRSPKNIQIAENINDLNSKNKSVSLASIKRGLKEPGHTTYNIKSKGNWLISKVPVNKAIFGITNQLRLNNYLLSYGN